MVELVPIYARKELRTYGLLNFLVLLHFYHNFSSSLKFFLDYEENITIFYCCVMHNIFS